MHKKFMNLITSKIFIGILYRITRIYSRTFRLTVENEKIWIDHLKTGSGVLLCTWHQHFFSFIRYFQNYKSYEPSLMISQSKDGDIVAGVAKLSGWYTARGSSSKDGKKALQEMIERLKMTGLAAHIVDGPRGPAGIVKKGAINLAISAQAVIVPVYAIAEKAWYFNSWDRFMLPKPFSKVTIRFDNMIKINKKNNIDSVEEQRKNLEEIMRPALRL
ncbi:MAG: lysophospholipid acyltransferase family protein [Spirochaetes bacterium]|nr:lysophospholipid acyltransferase family protein [Spirochaetota bacterium]